MADPHFDALKRIEAPLADLKSALLAHPQSHIDHVVACAPETGFFQIDPDTVMSPATLEAAQRAIGGAVHAVDEVVAGSVDNAFVAARPPGHHAERTRAMGFCFFNTAAIAALHAMAEHGAARVAVLDFDVHHG
ncbi:MAG: histone deacetylase family protein, partial [Rhodobiaceae bacterium]|nr:histone deacetylase family protein [Rhodobiaceae bacterium]